MRQPDALSKRVALAILIEMHRQGLSTDDLAKKIDKPYLWLHRRLKNTSPFMLEDLDLIADGLGVAAARFIEDQVAA